MQSCKHNFDWKAWLPLECLKGNTFGLLITAESEILTLIKTKIRLTKMQFSWKHCKPEKGKRKKPPRFKISPILPN